MAELVTVDTTNGPVTGFLDTNPILPEPSTTTVGSRAPIAKFLNVPFAKCRRFYRPQHPDPWTEPKPCFHYGPMCPQKPGRLFREMLSLCPEHARPVPAIEDDCLNLCVYAPENAELLPVLVYVYGGSWRDGCNAIPWYDATEYVRQHDVVVVVANYRVNIFGFLASSDIAECNGGHAGNFALHDQRFAIKWVHDNISRFGGDPGRVTLVGESAGAVSIAYQLTAGQPYFTHAVMQSGSALTMDMLPLSKHEQVYEYYLHELGIEGQTAQERFAQLCSLPAEQLLHVTRMDTFWSACVEEGPDAVWTIPPDVAIRQGGMVSSVKGVMMGHVVDEGTSFARNFGLDDPEKVPPFLARFGEPMRSALIKSYPPEAHTANFITNPMSTLIGHGSFVAPQLYTARQLLRIGIPVYWYVWRASLAARRAAGLGVHHASDLPYLFYHEPSLALPVERETARLVGNMWTAFAATGNPGAGWLPRVMPDIAGPGVANDKEPSSHIEINDGYVQVVSAADQNYGSVESLFFPMLEMKLAMAGVKHAKE